ncbi:MAG: hypothetical protein IPG06_02380 [Haliea sp.]|nr:hypothetical protein [Haliea sp.]
MLIDLLPASTRGILQLRGQGDTDPALALQASLDGNAPWRHNTVDILRYYSPAWTSRPARAIALLAQLTCSR